MTPVLVLTGLEIEARTLAQSLGLEPVAGSAWPRYRRGRLEVACVGLGATHLARRATAAGPVEWVVSAGLCGALAPALATGALVVPERLCSADGALFELDPVPGARAVGMLLCASDVIGSPADKARLWIETRALAVDMESAAIVAWARAQGRRAAVVRAVSDTAREVVPAELAAAINADGRLETSRAVRATLARPAMVPRALALRRGTAAALRTVATTLAAVTRGTR